MTIAIGLISKKSGMHGAGRIVLACESETTFSVSKNTDAKKLHVVEFKNGRALVVFSDSVDMGNSVIEKFKDKARETTIENQRTIANTAEQAMQEVRAHCYKVNSGVPIDWHRYFYFDYPLNLLIAYFFDQKPYLYSLNIDTCLAIPVTESYRGIGVGKELAEFLLKEYSHADPDFFYTDLVAISVIEKIKENVKGCGGPTWIGIAEPTFESESVDDFGVKTGDINPPELACDAFLYPRPLTDEIALESKKQESQLESEQADRLHKTLVSLCKRIGPITIETGDENSRKSRISVYASSDEDAEQIWALGKKKNEEKRT